MRMFQKCLELLAPLESAQERDLVDIFEAHARGHALRDFREKQREVGELVFDIEQQRVCGDRGREGKDNLLNIVLLHDVAQNLEAESVNRFDNKIAPLEKMRLFERQNVFGVLHDAQLAVVAQRVGADFAELVFAHAAAFGAQRDILHSSRHAMRKPRGKRLVLDSERIREPQRRLAPHRRQLLQALHEYIKTILLFHGADSIGIIFNAH